MLSIVIPTLDSEANIGRLLESLARQNYIQFEVLVVDGGSVDRTPEIARTFGANLISSRGNRSVARNVGGSAARGETLIFLDSDMIAQPDLVGACERASHQTGAVVIPERTLTRGNRWAVARALERDALIGHALYEFPRCFSSQVFAGLGGYDEGLVGMEDVDLRERALERGERIGRADTCVYHDEGDVGLREYIRKRAAYGLADRPFRSRHPAAWRALRAPLPRFALVLRRARNLGVSKGWIPLVELVIQRATEILFRVLQQPGPE